MDKVTKSQNYYTILSVLCVIVGIVLLVWPNLTMALLGTVSGIGLLVVGITHIIIYFTRDHFATILHMDLTVGVVCAALGSFILMHADFVELAIPFAIGIILMIGAMTKLQYALDMKHLGMGIWKFILVISIAILALGIVFIYNPFKERVLVYMIAASLIIDGIFNIISMLVLSHRLKRIAHGKAPMPQDGRVVASYHPIEKPGAFAQEMPPQPMPETDDIQSPVKY